MRRIHTPRPALGVRGLTAAIVALSILSSQAARCYGGPFAPAAGQPGSTAVPHDDPTIVGWASQVVELVRGPMNIADLPLGLASFGTALSALGPADATPQDATPVVSLGDGGHVTLAFERALRNGPGVDLVIFENGFSDLFLELGLVEVSTNGTDFFAFAAISLTQTAAQVGPFDPLDPTDLSNLAGKYRVGFGVPFDLDELAGVSPLLDIDRIEFVRIVDVVGSLDPNFQVLDSQSQPINDPWPTPFASGGFDLDAVGAMYLVPEPAGCVLLATGALVCWMSRRRRCGARAGPGGHWQVAERLGR